MASLKVRKETNVTEKGKDQGTLSETEGSVRVRLGALDPIAQAGVFEVICIRPGKANGVNFSEAVLRSGATLFENASCFVDHGGFFERSRSIRDIAGVITDARYETDRGVVGRLRLVSPSEWLSGFLRQLVADRAQGLAVPKIGLSADVFLIRKGGEVEEIRRVNSVDIVFDPAAGGTFERVLNSVAAGRRSVAQGGTQVTEATVVPKEDQNNPSSPVAVPVAVPTALPLLQRVAVPTQLDAQKEGAVLAATQTDAGDPARIGVDPPPVGVNRYVDDLRRVQCGAVLQSVLDANKDLPPAMAGLLLRRFQGSIFTGAQLETEVEAVRQAWADLQEANVIKGLGTVVPSGGVSGMLDSVDRIQMAFDRLMGLEVPGEHSDIPRLSGIRELYLMLTGDYEMYGRFNGDRVRFANITTSTMTSVVKNALNKVLLKSYNLRPQWWASIAHEEDFNTLNQITWITLGGIADLDTVTEGSIYTEKSWSDNEETSTFVKKGNYLGITLEMIDRDNVGSVRQLPRKLGLAAARTLAAAVSALFTDQAGTGPDLADTNPLFDSSNHDNLLTTALSAASWDTVIQAMFKQAEATSTKRQGVRPGYLLVPIELEKTALTIINSPGEPGTGDNDINVRQGSARVIAVPEWTDTNNWAAVADPLDLPGVCIGYRFGRAPELFVADQDAVGSMFTHDEMRIKIRFFYAVGIGDYRALHKNNVT